MGGFGQDHLDDLGLGLPFVLSERLRPGIERSIMETAGTRMNEPEMSFVDFCRMTEEVLVSIDKELVVKGVLIDEGLRKKMGELIIRSRKVTNPEG